MMRSCHNNHVPDGPAENPSPAGLAAESTAQPALIDTLNRAAIGSTTLASLQRPEQGPDSGDRNPSDERCPHRRASCIHDGVLVPLPLPVQYRRILPGRGYVYSVRY